MRHLAALVVLLSGSLAGATGTLEDGTPVAAPIKYQNLTLVPILAKDPPGKEDEYLVLDEGMDKKQVRIHEKDRNGNVNELLLENRSDKPLFLMAGEVILGGKQDRIISHDSVIPPKQKQTVAVFCVEHGRWAGKKASFETGKALAHTKLRKSAKYAGQGEVWDEVRKKNAQRGTANATDTYRHISEGGAEKAIKPYAAHVRASLEKTPAADRIVGFAVAVNGKVVAIERFGTPGLYRKLSNKLLRSYYVEVVDEPIAKDAPAVTVASIDEFVRKRKEAKSQVVRDDAAGSTENAVGRGIKATKVKAKPARAGDQEKDVYDSLYLD